MNQHASPTSGGSSGNNWLRIVYALVGIMVLGFVLGSLHSCQQQAVNRQGQQGQSAPIRGVNNRDQAGSAGAQAPELPPRGTVTIPVAPAYSVPVPVVGGTSLCLGLNPATDGFTRQWHDRRYPLAGDTSHWQDVPSSGPLPSNSNGERYQSTTSMPMDYWYVAFGQTC